MYNVFGSWLFIGILGVIPYKPGIGEGDVPLASTDRHLYSVFRSIVFPAQVGSFPLFSMFPPCTFLMPLLRQFPFGTS